MSIFTIIFMNLTVTVCIRNAFVVILNRYIEETTCS